jgi:type I restriction enzyme S subunit
VDEVAEVREQEHEDMANLSEGFKMTELGPLPEDWRVVAFSEAVLNERFGVGKVRQQEYQKAGRFPIVDQGQKLIAGYWDRLEDVYQGPLPVIIFGDHTRVFKFVDFPFVCGADGTKILVPDISKFFPAFLYFALTRLEIPNRGYNRHFSLLREQRLPCPPLPEQRAIAHVLRTVQRAKEATVQVIQATREMKKSLMRHLFTYGPVPVGEAERVPLKETEVGLVPEHWKVQVLENVASFVRDSLNPSNYPDEVFDYYSIPAYQETGSPILEVGKRIRSQKLVVEANDVLFGKLNPRIPKVLLVTASRRRKITSTEFIPLRASSRTVVPEYLYYLCWSNYVMRKAQELVSGSTPSRQRVDVRAFLSLPVPLPPLSEQREIVRILQSADKKLQAEEARKQALEELFKTLLHNLMTGKIRAKDVVLPNVGEGKGDVTN